MYNISFLDLTQTLFFISNLKKEIGNNKNVLKRIIAI